MIGLRRVLAVLLLPLILAGCGAEPKWAPDAVVNQALYSNGQPTSLTLFTVVSGDTGWGSHTGLMVNGTHRAIWDPAGTFTHPDAPERNDVHFGITEDVLKVYLDFYTRDRLDIIVQEIQVSPQVAAIAMREIQAYGAAPKAHCSRSTTEILQNVPGFQDIPISWFPRRTAKAFANRPGVREFRVTAETVDTSHGALIVPPTR